MCISPIQAEGKQENFGKQERTTQSWEFLFYFQDSSSNFIKTKQEGFGEIKIL